MVAPAYFEDTYVDTELSANLDSTFAFEGPEKLLELWFFDSEAAIPQHISSEGLRSIPLEDWVEVLDLVNCKVLSMKSSNEVDAYLLSESSLFVFAHKIILKTCGTTTTLSCLDKVFEIFNKRLCPDFQSKDIVKIFYSRRSFMFPLKQKHVHRDWKHEVALLSKFFDNGKSYVVGDFTSDDHWYLYMGGKGGNGGNTAEKSADQTFEILMTELDTEKAKVWETSRKPGSESIVPENEQTQEGESDLGHELGIDTMNETKLDCLFLGRVEFDSHLPSPSLSDNLEIEEASTEESETAPSTAAVSCSRKRRKSGPAPKCKFDFIHDAFSFTPCGFSSNSISRLGNYYYTLHITPESGWSYASFETNYPFHKSDSVTITDVLHRVLEIFKPGKFSATLVTDGISNPDVLANFDQLSNCPDTLLANYDYEKQEKVLYDLKDNYRLLYLNFSKK